MARRSVHLTWTSRVLEPLPDLVRQIDTRLTNKRDIRRTDVRFADLLDALPGSDPTLRGTLATLRSIDEQDITPELMKYLEAIRDRLASLRRLTLEQQLADGARYLFETEQDAEILIHRMGWKDGHMRKRRIVARECGATVARVTQCENRARRLIEERGLLCPALDLALRDVRIHAPMSDQMLATNMKRLGLAKIRWGCHSLFETATLFGHPLDLNLVRIGDQDHLLRIQDRTLLTWVVRWALKLTAGGQRSTASQVQKAISQQLKKRISRNEIRLVLAKIPKLKFHDNQHDVFSIQS